MARSKNHLIIVAVLVLLAAIGAIMNSGPASAAPGATSVSVVNPLPLPVSGAVAVNNFPSPQPISGTVNVSNLPATQVVGGTVNVGNFPTLQAVKEGGTPFQTTICVETPGVTGCTVSSYSVPSTQQAIIEFTSASCGVSAGALFAVHLNTTAGGTGAAHYFAPFMPSQIPAAGSSLGFTTGQQTRIYADPSTTVSAGLDIVSGTLASCFITISGRLV